MQSIDIVQLDGMRFAVRARDSEVIVDRPADAGGQGPGFRSGELVLGGLGTCSLGGVVTFAQNQGIPIDGISATVSAEELTHPARLNDIVVAIQLPAEIEGRALASLQRIANSCKIHKTLTSSPNTSLRMLGPDGQQLA